MKNLIKKIICIAVSILIVASFAGCSFSAGTKNPELKYADVFTRGEEIKLFGKYSMLSYLIDLQQYGNMNLYIDTTFGHKFELDGKTNTFNVMDENGETTVFGRFISEEQYRILTADTAVFEVSNINFRDLAIYFDEAQQRNYGFTYLADCGMNVGLVLEADDVESYKLLSFKGEAIEGSSSDINYYLGNPQTTTTADIPVPEESTTVSQSSSDVTTVPPTEEKWEIVFANGIGFNSSKYQLNLVPPNEDTGRNTYGVITGEEVLNVLETAVKQGTNYTDTASQLAEVLKNNSGETPVTDIHEEGAYITGIYDGMFVLVFIADGTDGLTYMMSLYTVDTQNSIDIFNSIIDDFLASGITAYNVRTEYGQPVDNSGDNEDTDNGEADYTDYNNDPESSMDVPDSITIPNGYECTYKSEYTISFGNGEMDISFNAQPDEEFRSFLRGETDTYYGVYQMGLIGSYTSENSGEITIAEASSDGIYQYFAGNDDGSIDVHFYFNFGDRISLEECLTFLKSFIK